MSELKLISPMLDNYDMGDPISEHDGVRCCPAMEKDSDKKYIVKIISIPASQTQLDALLLTGAYPNAEAALGYFKELADGVVDEVQILQRLSQLEGFLPFESWQTVRMESETGYHVYLLGSYKRTLERHFSREPMTHLCAINLGLDLCAALAVCRRAGYLYVDLKPGNIFVTDDKEYRIGDLGFVRLDSLKYASLPQKYRSTYTAPEIGDAFSPLNATIDIYAVGLILYQAYNNGVLPVASDDGTFAAPEYADYEMAEIILKACAPDPADRWQDPIEMGQALVSYMQRNGANDTPIVPAAAVHEEVLPEKAAEPEALSAEPAQEISEDIITDEAISEDTVPAAAEEEADAADEKSESSEDIPENNEAEETPTPADADESDSPYGEDSFGNLTFLFDLTDETDPGNVLDDIAYDEISDEVSEILSQADALADLQVPEPVIAPEPIEIPMPEPIPVDEEESDTDTTSDETAPEEPDAVPQPVDAVPEETELDDEDTDTEEVPKKKKSSGRWLLATLIILAVIAIAVAGFLYYRYFYLLPINNITLEGNEDTLVVLVDSDVDDSMLKVVCSDSHGNQMYVRVVDGKATFENLVPNTAYNVKVVVEGFHKLTGDTATAYSTPAQTSIVQFSAVTGAEDGSVILGFTVDGPDAGQWSVVYSAEGEAEQTVAFPSHMVTINGLTVGKEYTFKLVSDTELYVTGTSEIKFTASKLVYAQDLIIKSLVDGQLTAVWSAPQDTAVSCWTVRCYNDSSYNETIITAETTAVFENLNPDESYTVEVTAAGMSVSQRTYVAENALTVTNFRADTSDPSKLVLTWDTVQEVPAGGWLLTYSIDGADTQASVACTTNRAEIAPVIPGATYAFTLQEASGAAALAEPFICKVPEATIFSGYGITAENMLFDMYKAPNVVYTSSFTRADDIYLLITLQSRVSSSSDSTTVLFAIRDADGNVVSHDSTKLVWDKMWTGGDCILAIPNPPDAAGVYSVCIYFNGQFVTEQNFTITENAAS